MTCRDKAKVLEQTTEMVSGQKGKEKAANALKMSQPRMELQND